MVRILQNTVKWGILLTLSECRAGRVVEGEGMAFSPASLALSSDELTARPSDIEDPITFGMPSVPLPANFVRSGWKFPLPPQTDGISTHFSPPNVRKEAAVPQRWFSALQKISRGSSMSIMNSEIPAGRGTSNEGSVNRGSPIIPSKDNFKSQESISHEKWWAALSAAHPSNWSNETYRCVLIICSAFLVVFAGIASGLTTGFMAFDELQLLVLQETGTPAEQRQYVRICLCAIWFLISVHFCCGVAFTLSCTGLVEFTIFCREGTSFWLLFWLQMLLQWRRFLSFWIDSFHLSTRCS